MSRLDYVTIAIVAVCVAALVYLIYMTTNLLGREDDGALTEIEQTADNSEDTEDDTYYYDEEGVDGDTSSLSGNYNYDYDNPGELDKGRTSYDDDTDDASSNDDASFNNYDNTAGDRITTTTVSSGGDYLVLAGSYKQESNAAAMVSKLKGLGYDEASVEPFNRGAYAVALVARYDSYAEAKSLVDRLEEEGIDAMVKKKN